MGKFIALMVSLNLVLLGRHLSIGNEEFIIRYSETVSIIDLYSVKTFFIFTAETIS